MDRQHRYAIIRCGRGEVATREALGSLWAESAHAAETEASRRWDVDDSEYYLDARVWSRCSAYTRRHCAHLDETYDE